jgi:GNAT superfamily N-acetyltransferase
MSDSLRRRLVDIGGRRGAAVAAWAGGAPARVPIGIAQLACDAHGAADIAVAVVDAWQRRGVGRRLLAAVAELAEEIGCTELHGSVLAENAAMRGLVRSVFPEALARFDGDTVQFVVPIGVPVITHEDMMADLLYRGGR